MSLSRRTLMKLIAAGSCAAALPGRTIARTRIGTATLTTVSDGNLVLPGDFIFGPAPQDELPQVLSRFDVTEESLEPECNLALYQDGVNTVLFDVGSGPDFMPSAGELLDNLDAAGLTPGDVTHVVFTHAHPDHIWGLLDVFDEVVFPDAAYLMGEAEWEYWWNPNTVDTIGEARAAFAVGARRRMEAIEGRVERIRPDSEILPGIASVASFGHTPGHMSYEIRNGGDRAMVIGDAIGNHHVAFARPEWPNGADQDQDMGVITRTALLERLAKEGHQIVGFHLPNGGMGRVDRSSDGYVFVQEDA